MDIALNLFSYICGQASDRSYLFGGEMFPLCERCMGIYSGAAIAMILWWWARIRASQSVSTLLMLQIIPCGLHWCLDTPVLRTLSGVWFGFGLIGLLLSSSFRNAPKKNKSTNVMALTAPTAIAVFLACNGADTRAVGWFFVLICALGFSSIMGLILKSCVHLCRRPITKNKAASGKPGGFLNEGKGWRPITAS